MAKSRKVPSRTTALTAPPPADFDDVLRLIDAARGRAVAAVNKELIDLYWNIGEHISRKIAAEGWGQGTVEALAEHIRRRQPNARGFSAQQPLADDGSSTRPTATSQNSQHCCENCPGATTWRS